MTHASDNVVHHFLFFWLLCNVCCWRENIFSLTQNFSSIILMTIAYSWLKMVGLSLNRYWWDGLSWESGFIHNSSKWSSGRKSSQASGSARPTPWSPRSCRQVTAICLPVSRVFHGGINVILRLRCHHLEREIGDVPLSLNYPALWLHLFTPIKSFSMHF